MKFPDLQYNDATEVRIWFHNCENPEDYALHLIDETDPDYPVCAISLRIETVHENGWLAVFEKLADGRSQRTEYSLQYVREFQYVTTSQNVESV
jgi:hypothetical protein